ncbi:uncharacterized protein LOC128867444 [Anastrepha ludens]|uniref:uncharacterized protein LOC128867444 n=1 Tax=Anastrepha ludens TaxID=28586 RepID=UPI0023B10896|nr:uncharacterized protein LOC128867444 [Anastrepha ludens]
MIDSFTKFCWLFLTKTLNVEEVVKKFGIVADTFGYPNRVIADRGGAFISNVFRCYCEDHGVKLVHITAGVPRGNGQVERLNSTIISVLTKLCVDKLDKWFQQVPVLQRVLNNTFPRAIQSTPFELLVGVKMRTKNEEKIMQLVEEDWIDGFNKGREEARENAKKAICKIQEENRKQFNRKRKAATVYKINDLVAIERTQFGVGLKIKPKFLGPYRVVASKGFDRYKVEKMGDGEGPVSTTTSADKMKAWVQEGELSDFSENGETEDGSSSEADE